MNALCGGQQPRRQPSCACDCHRMSDLLRFHKPLGFQSGPLLHRTRCREARHCFKRGAVIGGRRRFSRSERLVPTCSGSVVGRGLTLRYHYRYRYHICRCGAHRAGGVIYPLEERLLRLAQQAGLALTCDLQSYDHAARHGQRWRPGGVASAENERRWWPLTPASLLSLRFGLAPTAPPTPTSRRRPRPRSVRRSHGNLLGRRTFGYASCLARHPTPAR